MRRRSWAFSFLLSATLAFAGHLAPKSQESFAPYWTSEPGWTTELQLKNNLPSTPLTVTPVLRLASGNEILLDPATIPPNSSVSVSVNEELLAHASDLLSQPGSYGSVVFRYTSPSAGNLYADVLLSIHGEPISFPMVARAESAIPVSPGSSLEGIWWQPRADLNDVLILGNHGDSKITGTLSLYDASGKRWNQQLVLGSHRTQRMAASDLLKRAGLSGSYGGISFITEASVASIDAAHFMYDEVSKFSSSQELMRRDPSATLREYAGPEAKHWTMYAPMLALQHPDPTIGIPAGTELQPMLIIRNTTAKKLTADLALTWRGDSGKGQVKLPLMQLAPFATQQYQIAAMQSLLRIPDNAHWGLVTLTTDAEPHDLVATAASIDASGRYTLETRFIGGMAGHFTGGEWTVDANHNEIAAITNVGAKPTDALLTLHYDRGNKKYELQQRITPGDQMWVNLEQLIRERVPDQNGNILPFDLKSVTSDVSDLVPGGYGLMVNTLGADTTYGFRPTNLVLNCCGYQSGSIAFDPNSIGLLIGQSDPTWIFGTDACNGEIDNVSPNFNLWGSNNTSIAKMTYEQAQAEATGLTNGFANGLVPTGFGNFCPRQSYSPNLQILIQPQITFNGTVITNTTQSVVVGQQIALNAAYTLPGGITMNSQSWSVPGTIVAGYNASPSSGSVNTNVTLDERTTTFYWISPGNSRQVTFTLLLSDGSILSATATFNVAGAAVSKMSTPTGSVGIFAGPVLEFGPTGIQFNPTLTTPTGDAGQFEWVQLITNDTQTLTTTSGTVYTCVNVTQPPTSAGTGLDTEYPYAKGSSTQDSPDIALNSSTYSKEARSFSAAMYLLWDPALPAGCTPGSGCTSIPVPQGSVTWGWSGTAAFSSGSWTLTASSKATPSWAPGNSYPTWTDLVPYNGQISCH
jgi:hypothetical protein